MSSEPPLVRISPIFPVVDLQRALDHYAALGFAVDRHDDGYGFASRQAILLHLEVVADMDPTRSPGGWHIDPDGNLLRFGSPLPSPA